MDSIMNRNKGFETKYEVMIELAYQRQNAKNKRNRQQRLYVENVIIPALERILKNLSNQTH